jgi:hypothetical protein
VAAETIPLGVVCQGALVAVRHTTTPLGLELLVKATMVALAVVRPQTVVVAAVLALSAGAAAEMVELVAPEHSAV